MTFRLKSYKTILFFSILAIAFSCNGQKASENTRTKTLTNKYPTPALGKPVAEIDGNALLIFQDRQHNIWFAGNKNGVYRYDGQQLVLFTKTDGLCSASVVAIQEDKSGHIYFDTAEGVSKFDGQKFTTLNVADSPASKNDWKLQPDDLWFRLGWDSDGPYRYDGNWLYPLKLPKSDQADEFYSKYPNVGYSPYGIYTIYTDSKGAVWFGTSSLGLCRFDGKSIRWLYEKHLTETPEGGSFGIRSIIEDQAGYFWFCNTRYRYEVLPDSAASNQITYRKSAGVSNTANPKAAGFPYFMSIVEDKAGDLWMATYSEGVWRKQGTTLRHYPIKDGDTDVLLFSIYKDRQGNLWLGTHNAGVYQFNGHNFEKFKLKK